MSMFNFDILENPKPLDLYLCKPDGKIICYLNGVDDSSASITMNLNNIHELSFDYYKYLDLDGKQVLTNGYESLSFGMTILVENIGYFKMEYPEENFDGEKDFKSIEAHSIDCELADKDLVNFKINTGEKSSLEYLVTYDDDETEELLNAYTGLPYDYIVFYNTYPEQLANILNKYSDGVYESQDIINDVKKYTDLTPRLKSRITTVDGVSSLEEFVVFTYDESGTDIVKVELLNFNKRVNELITFYTKYRNQLSLIPLAIEKCNCNWSVGEIDESLLNKKFQFDEESTNIYAFLTQTVAAATNCPIIFDIFKKTINAVLIDNLGEDSDVVLDRYNLVNTVNISCDENSICTRYNVKGGNDIGIQYVNFGTSRIDDLSYFLNATDNDGNRIYVSDELAEKYKQFVADRNLAREVYVSLTKTYNQALTDIDVIKYRVPNDCVQNDWDTFTNTELDTALTTYNQLLVTLESLYKEDYGNTGCNADGSINEDYIRTTEYWYDYFAYKQTIEQIKAAIYAHSQDSSYAEIDNAEVLDTIYAYKTEWTLYGTVELQNKITAYNNNMQVLVDGEAVVLKDGSDEAKTWDELTEDEKLSYSYLDINYQYDTYMKYYTERESCQVYFDTLMAQLELLEEFCDTAQSDREKLVELVTLETYDRATLGKLVSLPPSDVSGTFTEDEIKTITLLYIDKNYSNENILTTNLDTTVSEVDVQYELLQDAEENLSIESQPQISFSADIDNLLCVKEFQGFKFNIGNFVYLQYYDNYYVKLRLASMTFNPCVPTDDLEVTFTNFVKSRAKRTDISYLFGLSSGSSSGGSTSGSSSNSGLFGNSNDINVTISNTMLSKLLNTEMFGTRVSNVVLDTIKVNQLNAKYAKFDGLVKGTTTIDGACIKTGAILSNNYNGTVKENSSGYITDYGLDNTTGSIIELTNGKFSFGGGHLKWDGEKLSIDNGSIKVSNGTNTLSIDPASSTLLKLSNASENILTVDGDGNLVLTGKVTATSGYIGGTTGFEIGSTYIRNGLISSATNTSVQGVYIGTDGFNVSGGTVATTSYFTKSGMNIGGKLKWDGKKLSVNGDVTTNNLDATGGTIGGFTIGSSALYNGTDDLGGNSNSVYLGTDGISCGDLFKVTKDGKITATSGKISMFTFNGDDDGLNAYFSGSNILQYGLERNRFFVYLKNSSNNLAGHIDLNNGVKPGSSTNLSLGSLGDVLIRSNSNIYFCGLSYGTDGVDFGNAHVTINGSTGETDIYNKLTAGRVEVSGKATENGTGCVKYTGEISTTAMPNYCSFDSTGIIKQYSSSSKKYKHDITENFDETTNYKKLLELPVVTYHYNEGYCDDDEGKLHIGFIAEDVDRLFPVGCGYRNGEPENWNVMEVVPGILKIVQEHEMALKEKELEISLLKTELNKLKNR